jgi:hypothetical protein
MTEYAGDYSIETIMRLAEPYRKMFFPLMTDKRMDQTQRALVLGYLKGILEAMQEINDKQPENSEDTNE